MWGRKEESTPPAGVTPRAQPDMGEAAQTPKAAPLPSLGSAAAARGTEPSARLTAQIGKSIKLKGDISGSEDVYIDGEVEGTIELKENSLTVGPNGKVHANVSARSIAIQGRLQGNVRAGERIEIRKTGSLEGDIITARIVIEDGAVFRGSIDIVKPGQTAAETAEPKKAPVAGTQSADRPATIVAGAVGTRAPQPGMAPSPK